MFISLDLETTGFDPVKDKIIEFGAIKFDLSGVKEKLKFFVNPGIQIPQLITYITGIKDCDLKTAATFAEKKLEIENFIENLPIIGHNIEFDINFLKGNGIAITNPFYDTYELAAILLPNLPSYSLEILSHRLNLKHEEKHRALDDAIAAMELFQKLIEAFENLDPELIEEIKILSQKSDWHLKNLITTLKPDKNKPKKSRSTKVTENSTDKTSDLEDYSSILETKNSTLLKKPAPYNTLAKALAKNLAKHLKSSTVIALPNKLFLEIFSELPNSLIKIDLQKNYISLKRFSELKVKNHFENYELTAILKYLIWLKESKSGLLNEVKLLGEERKILEKINTATDDSPQITDKNKPIICTHDYLIKSGFSQKNLIIIDFEKFLDCLYFHSSGYLKLQNLLDTLKNLEELEQENETIKSLIGASTILFGLLGILFEKYRGRDQYSANTAILTEEILSSKEWLNIHSLVNNLIETSKKLGLINKVTAIPFLQNWKNHLKTLDFIVRQNNFSDYLNFLENDHEGIIIIRKIPVSIKLSLQKILDNFASYKLISEIANPKILELPENIMVEDRNRGIKNLEILIAENFEEDDHNKVTNFFKNYLNTSKNNVAIICNSKKQLEFLTLKLSQEKLNIISQLTGSFGKVEEQFLHAQKPATVLLTPYGWENFKHNREINTLFILKLPFEPPSSTKLIAKSMSSQDPFNEIQVPEAIYRLEKLLNKLSSSRETPARTVILDQRIINKSYGKAFIDSLKKIGNVIIGTCT